MLHVCQQLASLLQYYNTSSAAFLLLVTSPSDLYTSIGILRDENGKQVTDDQSKVDLLGKFFSSVFTNDNHVTPQIDKLVDPDIELSDVHFSPDLFGVQLIN